MKYFVLFFVVFINLTLFAQAGSKVIKNPALSSPNDTCLIHMNVNGAGSGQVQVDLYDSFTHDYRTYTLPCTIKKTGAFLAQLLYIYVTVLPDSMSKFVNTTGDAISGYYVYTSSSFGAEVRSLDYTFTINLERTKNLLTLNNGGFGSGSIKVNDVTCPLPYSRAHTVGSSVKLEAVPCSGNVFTSWQGDLTGKVNPVNILMDNDKSITATFKSAYCTLMVYKAGSGYGRARINGTLYDLPYAKDCTIGENITIEAVPDNGSIFSCWSDSLTGSTNPVTITMDDFKTITANFTIVPYTLSLNKTGTGNGKVIVNNVLHTLPYSGAYAAGAVVNLKAVPDSANSFNFWKGDLTGTNNPASVTMDGNKNISADFSAVKTLQITSAGTGTGYIKVDGAKRSLPFFAAYTIGQQITIEAVPDSACLFNQWNGSFTGSTNPITITLNDNVAASAVFDVILKYNLDISKSGNGNGQVKVNGILQTLPYSASFDQGTQVMLEAVAAEGSRFINWNGDLTGSANPSTITLIKNSSISLEFKQNVLTKISLLSPSDGSKGIPANLNLKWKVNYDSASVLTFTFQIAKDEKFDTLFNNYTTAITQSLPDNITSVQLGGFDYKTKYYWRVTADSNGKKIYSDTWSFTTQCKPITAPDGLTASAQDNKVLLNWNDNSDNELYFAVLRKDGDSLSTAAYQVIDTIQAGKTSYSDLKIQPASVYSYKVYAFNTDTLSHFSNQASVTTSAATAIAENSVLKVFSLGQNYPNPFNPVTVISYQLPVSCNVELKVYDLLGNVVAALVNETKTAGNHQVKFDGSNLASGMYIYKITAGSFTSSKKLLLMK